MQTKRLILFASIVLVLSLAFFNFPTQAVGEEGTATLYLYTDPERTTLVELDSNSRYYVVPGTEYYFTLDGITEHDVGETITVWVYRTNTAENIPITQVTVDSNPFDTIFEWTFPEDWLEEPAKIKYGTDLETDWHYAQGEIWVNCIVGTGILHVYMDQQRTIEAPKDEWENYLVLSGVTYYFSLTGITEYENTVKVWASYWDPPPFWKFTNILVDEFAVSENIEFTWTIPTLPIETTLRFKYGKNVNWPHPNWLFAAKPTLHIFPLPRKLFVVTEILLGPLGALAALFAGYKIKTLPRRKKVKAFQSH